MRGSCDPIRINFDVDDEVDFYYSDFDADYRAVGKEFL